MVNGYFRSFSFSGKFCIVLAVIALMIIVSAYHEDHSSSVGRLEFLLDGLPCDKHEGTGCSSTIYCVSYQWFTDDWNLETNAVCLVAADDLEPIWNSNLSIFVERNETAIESESIPKVGREVCYMHQRLSWFVSILTSDVIDWMRLLNSAVSLSIQASLLSPALSLLGKSTKGRATSSHIEVNSFGESQSSFEVQRTTTVRSRNTMTATERRIMLPKRSIQSIAVKREKGASSQHMNRPTTSAFVFAIIAPTTLTDLRTRSEAEYRYLPYARI